MRVKFSIKKINFPFERMKLFLYLYVTDMDFYMQVQILLSTVSYIPLFTLYSLLQYQVIINNYILLYSTS